MANDYRQRLLVIPAILLFYFLALNSMVGDSPTMDEQNHIARGLAYMISGNETIPAAELPASFNWLGGGSQLGPVPNPIVLMSVLFVIAHVMMTRTTASFRSCRLIASNTVCVGFRVSRTSTRSVTNGRQSTSIKSHSVRPRSNFAQTKPF